MTVILIAGFLLVVIFVAKNREHYYKKSAVGLNAPLFELKDTDGRVWRLADLRGKVVLLNIWASWCDVCKEELPSIQNLITGEKKNDRLVFISVLYNDDPNRAMSYLKARGFVFPVLIDTGDVASGYGITGVPETFVIDKKGFIKERVIGALHWDSPEVKAVLASLENE